MTTASWIERQSDCYPDGVGVLCAGASGGTNYDFAITANGAASLNAHFYSDGACDEPGTDCGEHRTVVSFQLPPHHHLIPDPAGTFPPLTASAFEP